MKKYDRTYIFIFIALFLLFYSTVQGQGKNPDKQSSGSGEEISFAEFTQSQLLEDFRFFSDELKKTHPNLYLFVTEEELDAYLKNAEEQINRNMTEIEFLRILSSVAEKVGCGHLGVGPSDEYQRQAMTKLKLVPVLIKFIDGKVYISEYYGREPDRASKAELLGINGADINEVIDKIADGLCTDQRNMSSKIQILEHAFPVVYSNHIGFSDEYRLKIKNESTGETEEISVKGVSYNELFGNYLKNHPDESPGVFPVILRFEDADKTAILRIKAFAHPDRQKYAAVIDSVFREIKDHGSEYLILDLRGNMGGRPPLSNAVLSYIAKNEYIYFEDTPVLKENYPPLVAGLKPAANSFKGEVVILMDGGCKSSTGHFISLAKYHKWATLIGAETGATFYCNDGSRKLLLPNTRAHFNLPTREVMTHVEGFDKRTPLKPDLEIHSTYEDLVTGTDPLMQFASDYIKKKEAE